jgi:hypothetical protein
MVVSVLAGVDRARRQGKRFGRPGVIVDRQKIAAMKANGQSIKSIAVCRHLAQQMGRRTTNLLSSRQVLRA